MSRADKMFVVKVYYNFHHEHSIVQTNCPEVSENAEGPDINCFVIFLDFHFNSDKSITGANQNSRLGSYKNKNLILKTTE